MRPGSARYLLDSRSVADLQAGPRLGTTGQLYHHLRQLVAVGWLHQTTRGPYEVPAARVIPLLAMLTAAEHCSLEPLRSHPMTAHADRSR